MNSIFTSWFLNLKLETSLEEARRLRKSVLDLRSHGLQKNELEQMLKLPPEYLSSLKFLYLQSNSIATFSRNVCHVLDNLKGLTLDYNKLTDIPFDFRHLRNLTILNVSHNTFVGLHFFHVICQLEKLRILWANGTGLCEIPHEIKTLKNLRTLGLRRNFIKGIPLELVRLPNLRWLTLANNEISQLPLEINQMTALMHLNLQGNKLTSLPGTFNLLPELRYLFLSRNKLKVDASFRSFIQSLPNLKYCSVSKTFQIRSASSLEISDTEQAIGNASQGSIDASRVASQMRNEAVHETVSNTIAEPLPFPVDIHPSRHQIESSGEREAFSSAVADSNGMTGLGTDSSAQRHFQALEQLETNRSIRNVNRAVNDSLLKYISKTRPSDDDKCSLEVDQFEFDEHGDNSQVDARRVTSMSGSFEIADSESRTGYMDSVRDSEDANQFLTNSHHETSRNKIFSSGDITSSSRSTFRTVNIEKFVDDTIQEGVTSAKLSLPDQKSSEALIFIMPHGKHPDPYGSPGTTTSIQYLNSSSSAASDPSTQDIRHGIQSPLESSSWSSSSRNSSDSAEQRPVVVQNMLIEDHLIERVLSDGNRLDAGDTGAVDTESNYDPSDWEHSAPSSAIDDQDIAARFNDFQAEEETDESEPSPVLIHDWEWRQIMSMMFLR